MIKITMQPTVNMDDICTELHLSLRDFECCQMVENDSYIVFDCSDEHVDELGEELEWQATRGETSHYQRLFNDYALLNLLRAQGCLDSVLIYVSW